jgi:hypothetical protein
MPSTTCPCLARDSRPVQRTALSLSDAGPERTTSVSVTLMCTLGCEKPRPRASARVTLRNSGPGRVRVAWAVRKFLDAQARPGLVRVRRRLAANGTGLPPQWPAATGGTGAIRGKSCRTAPVA